MKTTDRFGWVYSASGDRELAERYDSWAGDYEHDVLDLGRVLKDERVFDMLVKYVPKESQVLEAGAGTGMVGQHLYTLGYRNLVAIDLSAGMLAEAEKKGVYRELLQMKLGDPLGFPTDSFDAVVAVGVFTIAHASADAFDEIIRITKPGGHIIFTVRPEFCENSGFMEKLVDLEKRGKWAHVELGERYQPHADAVPDLFLQAWAFTPLER